MLCPVCGYDPEDAGPPWWGYVIAGMASVVFFLGLCILAALFAR